MLIADDSAALRERLAEMFARIEGIEIVGQARDVPEALGAIRALQPDVVILDIQMPGGSGIDVLRELKRLYPASIAIMLTNHPYVQFQCKCRELGADYFICKSTGSSLLIELGERLAARVQDVAN
jgi:DNA-binding NarL/FixJ family response regulator